MPRIQIEEIQSGKHRMGLPPGVRTKHEYREMYHLKKGRYFQCKRCGAILGIDSILCVPGYRKDT